MEFIWKNDLKQIKMNLCDGFSSTGIQRLQGLHPYRTLKCGQVSNHQQLSG
uniref:Uncharacterized protein n=1 Tax=Oryzias melastigma TaxID=30732 RepID=A0A3B3CGX1_ORYME